MKRPTTRAANYTGRKKNRYISAYLTEQEFVTLQTMAVQNEMTINGMVRRLINEAPTDNRGAMDSDPQHAAIASN